MDSFICCSNVHVFSIDNCLVLNLNNCSISLSHSFLPASLQILFVAGIACIIGLQGTYNFFFKPEKLKASLFFFAGIGVVLFGWAIIGFLIELYGIYLLFGYVCMCTCVCVQSVYLYILYCILSLLCVCTWRSCKFCCNFAVLVCVEDSFLQSLPSFAGFLSLALS